MLRLLGTWSEKFFEKEFKDVTVGFDSGHKLLLEKYRGVLKGQEHENDLHFGLWPPWPEVVTKSGRSYLCWVLGL